MNLKYFSTFSGIGGFELGIQQAYVEKFANSHRRAGRNYYKPECVGYSEIDKYAIQVYNKQFNHKNYGDITKINAKELPDFDLLVGGFPCQSFSIGGWVDGMIFHDLDKPITQFHSRMNELQKKGYKFKDRFIEGKNWKEYRFILE